MGPRASGRTAAAERHNAVRRHRRDHGLSQAALAEGVGVSRQTVIAIEQGDYAPSVYLALRLARVLGTSVEVLFGDETDETGEQ